MPRQSCAPRNGTSPVSAGPEPACVSYGLQLLPIGPRPDPFRRTRQQLLHWSISVWVRAHELGAMRRVDD